MPLASNRIRQRLHLGFLDEMRDVSGILRAGALERKVRPEVPDRASERFDYVREGIEAAQAAAEKGDLRILLDQEREQSKRESIHLDGLLFREAFREKMRKADQDAKIAQVEKEIRTHPDVLALLGKRLAWRFQRPSDFLINEHTLKYLRVVSQLRKLALETHVEKAA